MVIVRGPCPGRHKIAQISVAKLAHGGGASIPARAQAPEAISFPADKNGQITFVMPSQNVECTYTPAGGTPIYKPLDGGPELSAAIRPMCA
jgi:hypothetical protein